MRPDVRRVDAILVIDTSTSMTERTPAGRTKIDAAIAAAHAFLDALRVDPSDQAAMASRPAYAYRAPEAEGLADIYAQIAVDIPCPADAFWGGR